MNGSPHPEPPRAVRSYVRRLGRTTPAQQRALASCWPRFGVDIGELQRAGPAGLDAVFGRRAPRYLEIGFGMGEALLEMACSHPECDYLGVEVYDPGVGRVLGRLAADGIANVRVFHADALAVLERALSPASLDGVFLFFPDPWPKKRHHKRRIVQPGFVTLLSSRMVPGGRLHLATDWEDYAQHMVAVLDAERSLINAAGAGNFSPRPPERPATRFERRGERLGHPVRDLIYERVRDGGG